MAKTQTGASGEDAYGRPTGIRTGKVRKVKEVDWPVTRVDTRAKRIKRFWVG